VPFFQQDRFQNGFAHPTPQLIKGGIGLVLKGRADFRARVDLMN
jgi:hypothetical protein